MRIPESDPRGLVAGGAIIFVLAGVLAVVYAVVDRWVILPLAAVALALGVGLVVVGLGRRRGAEHRRSTASPGPVAEAAPSLLSVPAGRPVATGPTSWQFVASGNRSVIEACFEQFSTLAEPPTGFAALFAADADQLDRRAHDSAAPGHLYAGSRRLGQGDLSRVDTAQLLRGFAHEAVKGEVYVAMAAGDSPILASSIYGEIYREAVEQGILPFPMYSVQDQDMADYVVGACRLIESTEGRLAVATAPQVPVLHTGDVGRPEADAAATTPVAGGEGAAPAIRGPAVATEAAPELRAARGLMVTGGGDASRALAEASYDVTEASGVIIGRQAGSAGPDTVRAEGLLTCPGCGKEIPFSAVVSPGFMGDGGTAICDVCHSRVALSYYPHSGMDDWGALLVAHTLVSPSQRQRVEILSMSVAPQQ